MAVDQIEDIDKSEEARESSWNDLIIPEGYRELLVSLVNIHATETSTNPQGALGHPLPRVQIDLVRGKGRGLIILLHGPPGTGKTSTAETIASFTGRALYAITVGDLGTTVDNVEKRLRYHTELAEKWGCVLLLDEADIFLRSRGWDDMSRNALVSGTALPLQNFRRC